MGSPTFLLLRRQAVSTKNNACRRQGPGASGCNGRCGPGPRLMQFPVSGGGRAARARGLAVWLIHIRSPGSDQGPEGGPGDAEWRLQARPLAPLPGLPGPSGTFPKPQAGPEAPVPSGAYPGGGPALPPEGGRLPPPILPHPLWLGRVWQQTGRRPLGPHHEPDPSRHAAPVPGPTQPFLLAADLHLSCPLMPALNRVSVPRAPRPPHSSRCSDQDSGRCCSYIPLSSQHQVMSTQLPKHLPNPCGSPVSSHLHWNHLHLLGPSQCLQRSPTTSSAPHRPSPDPRAASAARTESPHLS